MSTLLCIDTSTSTCSVALTRDREILLHYEDFEGRNHSAVLSGYIKGCLDHIEGRRLHLDAIAVTLGPGSYTGLRIGLSEAKGLAFARHLPLIGLSTLEVMATGAMFAVDLDPETLIVPMIDARRMEVYTAVYDFALQTLLEPQPMILDSTSFGELLDSHKMAFVGDGAAKASTVISHPNAIFPPCTVPMAGDMMAPAERDMAMGRFIDVAYSTPIYLKDFQATKPKNKL